jgi:HEAT repeat protein
VGSSDGQGSAPASWFEDPDGRHHYRFWDGTAWTDQSADNGQQSLAPLAAQPVSVADDDAAREHAVEELARIGDPSVIPALREALGDSSYDVRSAAIKALGEMGPVALFVDLAADDAATLCLVGVHPNQT